MRSLTACMAAAAGAAHRAVSAGFAARERPAWDPPKPPGFRHGSQQDRQCNTAARYISELALPALQPPPAGTPAGLAEAAAGRAAAAGQSQSPGGRWRQERSGKQRLWQVWRKLGERPAAVTSCSYEPASSACATDVWRQNRIESDFCSLPFKRAAIDSHDSPTAGRRMSRCPPSGCTAVPAGSQAPPCRYMEQNGRTRWQVRRRDEQWQQGRRRGGVAAAAGKHSSEARSGKGSSLPTAALGAPGKGADICDV